MNNNDYAFMKTGENIEIDNNNEDTILRILSIYTIFTEDALKIAGYYTNHTGRRTITVDDISNSLKIRAYNSSYFWNRSNIQDQINSVYEELKNDNQEYDEKSCIDTVENYIQEYNKIPNCKCDICNVFNDINNKWREWVPSSDEDKKLKNVIDNIDRHKS